MCIFTEEKLNFYIDLVNRETGYTPAIEYL